MFTSNPILMGLLTIAGLVGAAYLSVSKSVNADRDLKSQQKDKKED